MSIYKAYDIRGLVPPEEYWVVIICSGKGASQAEEG